MTKRIKMGLGLAALVAVVVIASGYYLFWAPMFSLSEDPTYLYIDADDTEDSVSVKVSRIGESPQTAGFALLNSFFGKGKVRTGRYEVSNHTHALSLFRMLHNGMQTPLKLTLTPVRTSDRLASFLSTRLMMDSATVARALLDSTTCSTYGFTPETVMAMFIPNTYEVYWDVSVEHFLQRMQREYAAFWTDERKNLAQKVGLTPVEVATLASIMDEETANDGERPRMAGMYLNRLRIGMPLQADPTIKFAWKNFGLRRIYHNLLTIDSPYNTYRYVGLPPGPIRMASVASIEAVLHHESHDYLYMCAKEDFSGTHNYAATYAEHRRNAKRYTDALNRRNIK